MKDPKITITAEEWDFRGVTTDELAMVLCYEVARSRPADRDDILEWQRTRFRGFSDAVLLRLHLDSAKVPQPGVTVVEALRGVADLPESVRDMLREELGADLPSSVRECAALKQIALFFDQFPTPWMALPVRYRRCRIPPPPPPKCPIIVELPYKNLEPLDEERWPGDPLPEADYPVRCHALVLDWSYSNKILTECFANWLRTRRPPNHTGNNYVGKYASRPFDWLKHLSALRLSGAGISHAKAENVISKRKADRPKDGDSFVLPKYESAGAWSHAIHKARKLLIGPNPYWEITFRCHHLPHMTDAVKKIARALKVSLKRRRITGTRQ